MKICPNCGKRYEENQNFCKTCGVRLVEENQRPSGNPPVKKKSHIGLYIMIVIFAICIGAGAFAVIKISDNKKQEEAEQSQVSENDKSTDKADSKDAEEKDSKETKKDTEEDVEPVEGTMTAEEKAKAEEEKQKEEEKKKEEKKKEEEEQKELLKKYEEQEAQEAEAAKKAEEEQKEQESASNNQSASTSSSSSTNSSTDSSLYASWSDKLVGAEQSDTAILNEVGSADDFNTKMAKQEARYQLWDGLLNQMWQDLKASLPEDQMSQLTSAQVDWIHQKEAMISQYWESQNVDHSGFNEAPAADTTKQRVYYLLDYCPRSN